MSVRRSVLASWTPEQVARGRRWVGAWRHAGVELERIRRRELVALDPFTAIALLCGSADYRVPPRAPKPVSGLTDQQRVFQRLGRKRP
jgi:hypothetical protein